MTKFAENYGFQCSSCDAKLAYPKAKQNMQNDKYHVKVLERRIDLYKLGKFDNFYLKAKLNNNV